VLELNLGITKITKFQLRKSQTHRPKPRGFPEALKATRKESHAERLVKYVKQKFQKQKTAHFI